MLTQSPHRHRHAGFSLVEIMVGIAVGMLGIVVMTQMYSVFENQKRSSASGNDAQNSGAIILHQLQRDIRHSGYGISALNLLGCDVTLRTSPATVTLAAIAPVTINPASSVVPAGDLNTDTLLVVYGNSNGPTQGDTINQPPDDTHYPVNSPAAFASGERVIAEPATRPTPCTLKLDSVNGNPTATTVAVTLGQAGVSNGTLYNLGMSPKILAYAIRNGSLTVCDYMVNNCSATTEAFWVPIASDIVSMRAQYGRDTNSLPMDGIVNTYDQATPSSTNLASTASPANPSIECAWAKVSAVRIALVARGAAGGSASATDLKWAGSTVADNNPTAVPIVLTNTFTDTNKWKNYRYKVFETTVPIRNIVWMGVQEGC